MWQKYICPICKGIFKVNIRLKGHISSEHDKNKSYKCPIFVVLFAVNIASKGHISSENDKNKFCKFPICVVIFAVNITLKSHISSEHEKNKSYICPICEDIFAVNQRWIQNNHCQTHQTRDGSWCRPETKRTSWGQEQEIRSAPR